MVLARPTTKSTLNNSGDTLLLIQPNTDIIDTVTYKETPRGQSYNRTESDWVWSIILTPGSVNIVSELKENFSEGSTAETEIIEKEKELAAISESIQPSQDKQIPIFLIAFGLAIFSGVIILILKKKIKVSKIEQII